MRKHNRHPTQMRVVEDLIQNVFFSDRSWLRAYESNIYHPIKVFMDMFFACFHRFRIWNGGDFVEPVNGLV